MPQAVREQTVVVLLFVLLDTITGVWLAAHGGAVQSKKLTTRLVAKLLQYSLLVGVATGAALLAKSWFVISGALMAIIGIESISIIENMALLERAGGVKVVLFRAFLQSAGRYLAVTKEAIADAEETAGTARDRRSSRASSSRGCQVTGVGESQRPESRGPDLPAQAGTMPVRNMEEKP
ncbi:MAG: hypothetical protein A2W00_04530 [Candidatus Eisenbacteria bacterium RBG_16_71_46]|nr:MAG: hypothetical protein A2W00_04530 [Candidatus Eisenbacteria bacterium RBG_16_71_46]